MFRPSHFALVLVVGGLGVLAPAPAWSGVKPHCRDLTFAGAAGAASNDKVTLRMVDSAGDRVDDSCQLQVRNNESAKDFAARLVGAWGPGTGSPCLEPVPLPKKTCGNGVFGQSCNHKFKFKPDKTTLDPNDGLILVRICCFNAANCKGAKLLITPISAQTKVDPAVTFAPAVPPPVGITVTPVALDPIGMRQQPPGVAAGPPCRQALADAVADLSRFTAEAITGCHRDVMAGTQPPATDCGMVAAADAVVGTAVDKLEAAALTACEPTAPPVSYGYDHCPPPCPPGPIMSWTDAARCIACLTEGAAMTAVSDTYGSPPPGPGLPEEVQQCQNLVGSLLNSLLRTYVGETAACQKLVDSSKRMLPEGVPFCKDADLRGRREAAEENVFDKLDLGCLDATGLNGCADDDTCIIDNALLAGCKTADAVFPEGRAEPCSPGGAFLDATVD